MSASDRSAVRQRAEPPSPDTRHWFERHDGPIAAGLVLAVVTVVLTLRTDVVWDDPAILERYAVNLAGGDGWTFNPGQVTQNAVTSPLTVLVLAALLRVSTAVGGPGGVAVVGPATGLLFCVATWCAAFFTYLALRRIDREIAGLAAAILIATSPVLISLRGMESALYLALVALVLWAMAGDRPLLLGTALGLCVLVRPDSVVLAAAVVGWLMLRSRRIPVVTATVLSAVVVGWLVVSKLVTGTFLPSTLDAKIAQAQSGAWPTDFATLTHVMQTSPAPTWTLLMLPLVLGGAWVAVRQEVGLLAPLAAAAAVHLAVYGMLHVAAYPWHMVLEYYLAIVLAGVAVGALWPRLRERRSFLARALVIGYVAWLVVSGFGEIQKMEPNRSEIPLVSDWLARNTSPTAVVAAGEVGSLGLLSDRRMVDYLGLLDSRANDHLRRQDWNWWLAAYQPDYWVTYRTNSWAPLTPVSTLPWFGDVFRPVYETQYMVVYQRVAPVPSTA